MRLSQAPTHRECWWGFCVVGGSGGGGRLGIRADSDFGGR